MKLREQLIKFFSEKGFTVHDFGDIVEVETSTERGTSMLFEFQPFTKEEIVSVLRGFDVEEEVELHRQDQTYRNAFSLREALDDFENFKNRVNTLIVEVQDVGLYNFHVTYPTETNHCTGMNIKAKNYGEAEQLFIEQKGEDVPIIYIVRTDKTVSKKELELLEKETGCCED